MGKRERNGKDDDVEADEEAYVAAMPGKTTRLSRKSRSTCASCHEACSTTCSLCPSGLHDFTFIPKSTGKSCSQQLHAVVVDLKGELDGDEKRVVENSVLRTINFINDHGSAFHEKLQDIEDVWSLCPNCQHALREGAISALKTSKEALVPIDDEGIEEDSSEDDTDPSAKGGKPRGDGKKVDGKKLSKHAWTPAMKLVFLQQCYMEKCHLGREGGTIEEKFKKVGTAIGTHPLFQGFTIPAHNALNSQLKGMMGEVEAEVNDEKKNMSGKEGDVNFPEGWKRQAYNMAKEAHQKQMDRSDKLAAKLCDQARMTNYEEDILGASGSASASSADKQGSSGTFRSTAGGPVTFRPKRKGDKFVTPDQNDADDSEVEGEEKNPMKGKFEAKFQKFIAAAGGNNEHEEAIAAQEEAFFNSLKEHQEKTAATMNQVVASLAHISEKTTARDDALKTMIETQNATVQLLAAMSRQMSQN